MFSFALNICPQIESLSHMVIFNFFFLVCGIGLCVREKNACVFHVGEFVTVLGFFFFSIYFY